MNADAPVTRAAQWMTSGVIALAALVHQFNAVLLGLGLVGLAISSGLRGRDWPRLRHVALGSAALIAVGYSLIGAVSVRSLWPPRIARWLVGYAIGTTYGQSFRVDSLGPAAHSITDTFLHDPWTSPLRGPWMAAGLVGALLTLAGAFAVRRLSNRRRRIALVSAAQCLVGWALIVWWWPAIPGKWWIQTLPFLIIWWDGAFEGKGQRAEDKGQKAEGRKQSLARTLINAAPFVAGLACLCFNLYVAMRIERRPDPDFEHGLATWLERSTPDDVLIENGRFTGALLYWSGRARTMNVYQSLQVGIRTGDALSEVREVIARAFEEHRRVFFAPNLDPYFYTDDQLKPFGITRQDLIDCFDRYQRYGPVFEYAAWPNAPPIHVYRLDSVGGGI